MITPTTQSYTGFADRLNTFGVTTTLAIGLALKQHSDNNDPSIDQIANNNTIVHQETTMVKSQNNKSTPIVYMRPKKDVSKFFEAEAKSEGFKRAYVNRSLGDIVKLEI